MHVKALLHVQSYGTDISELKIAYGALRTIPDVGGAPMWALELPDYGIWYGEDLSDLIRSAEEFDNISVDSIRPETDEGVIRRCCSCSECERSVIGHGLGLAQVS